MSRITDEYSATKTPAPEPEQEGYIRGSSIPAYLQRRVLADISEVDLVHELYVRGIDLHYIEGAYYALGEMDTEPDDDEVGLHGRKSDMPKQSDIEHV